LDTLFSAPSEVIQEAEIAEQAEKSLSGEISVIRGLQFFSSD
jgi:hypothetical protein